VLFTGGGDEMSKNITSYLKLLACGCLFFPHL